MKQGLPGVPDEATWLVSNTPSGSRIGYDPKQLSFLLAKTYQNALTEAEYVVTTEDTVTNKIPRKLVDIVESNLVDLVWDKLSQTSPEGCSKPIRSANALTTVPLSFSGQTWQEKVHRVRKQMATKCVSILALSALDEIAWLLNLRGSDVRYNPVFYAYLLVTLDKVHLFLNPNSVSQCESILKAHFNCPQTDVLIHPYCEFFSFLATIIPELPESRPRVWCDPSANCAMVTLVPESQRLIATSPVSEMKAVKLLTELNGIRQAQLVDSLVLCDFLAWLEQTADVNRSMDLVQPASPIQGHVCDPAGQPGIPAPALLTERSTADYLDMLRAQSSSFVSLSFDTIAAVDRNGSIIHYRPIAGEDAPVTVSSLYLVDSGGQYLTGTTDVTRTIHLDAPTLEQTFCYTLVLKAHIAVASQIFPDNTLGSRLDVLSRRELWNYQKDFAHGTGHGVGAFLCVHEGPIGLSGSRFANAIRMGLMEPGLRENMVITIEPGYYLNNGFGIRLENVNFVCSAPFLTDSSTVKWLAFTPVTLVPFQRKLIDPTMLTAAEVLWLNQYHAQVRSSLKCHLLGELECSYFDPVSLSSSRRRCWEWILRETEAFI